MGDWIPRRLGGDEYAFFFSYSRANDDKYLRDFFKDLQSDVQLLKNRHWSGFIDQRQSIGQEWDDNIEKALATSRVLVSLYSGDYFEREACGKEFQVFLNRRREYRRLTGVKPSGIIPVLWAPCNVPPTAPRFLYNAEPGSLYAEQGLQFIASVGDEQVTYRRLVRKIATLICQSADQYELPHARPQPAFSTIANAFEPSLPLCDYDSPDATAGLNSAIFAFLNQPDTTPLFSPPDHNAFLYIASAVAMGMEIEPHQFRFTSQMSLTTELQKMASSNSLVVLVVDGSSLADPGVRAKLEEFDSVLYDRAAVTILWGPSVQRSQLQTLLAQTLVKLFKRRAPVFHHPVENARGFAAAVRQSLDHLQTKLTGAMPEGAIPRAANTGFLTLPQLKAPGQREAA